MKRVLLVLTTALACLAALDAQAELTPEQLRDPLAIKALVLQADPASPSGGEERREAWENLFMAVKARPVSVLRDLSALAARRDRFDEAARRAYFSIMHSAFQELKGRALAGSFLDDLIVPLKRMAVDSEEDYILRWHAVDLLGRGEQEAADGPVTQALGEIAQKAGHDNLVFHAIQARRRIERAHAPPLGENLVPQLEAFSSALSGS